MFILDQISKYFFTGKNIEIASFFSFSYVQNTGAGFGFLQGQNSALIWLTIAFLGILFYYYDQIPEKKSIVIFVGLVLGGALGNLIDRIFFGFVKDFISFSFWPSFNIADSAITIGAIGLLVYLWQKK